jgi:hypothetical protein
MPENGLPEATTVVLALPLPVVVVVALLVEADDPDVVEVGPVVELLPGLAEDEEEPLPVPGRH